MAKGLEMPIAIIIVICVAVLVLVTVAALFVSGFSSGANDISSAGSFASACVTLKSSYSCIPARVNDIRLQGTTCNLASACSQKGASNAENCAVLCGCSIDAGTSSKLLPSCSGTGSDPSGLPTPDPSAQYPPSIDGF